MTKALMQLILICIYSAQVEILNPSALQSQQQKKIPLRSGDLNSKYISFSSLKLGKAGGGMEF